MIIFFARRFLTSALVVLTSTLIMYAMVAASIDPLEELRGGNMANKEALMERLSQQLRLDDPVIVRYIDWLKGALGCTYGQCDLGEDWKTHETVTHALSGAIVTTLQLVFAATILAIIGGAAVGIISALRQYSGFDYSITFMSFLMYSLPVFWVAVLAKAFLAIDFNDWLRDPGFGPMTIGLVAAGSGIALGAALGGDWMRRARVFGATAVLVAGLMLYLNVTDFFIRPSQGRAVDLLVITVLGIGLAFLVTLLSTGLRNRKALYSALTSVGIGAALYFPMLEFWNSVDASWLIVILLALVALGVGIAVGYGWGGPDWGRSSRTAAFTAFLMAGLLFVDRLGQSWNAYVHNPRVKGRPLATIGSGTPNLEGSFWIQTIDLMTHIALPSVTLVLISFAGYTRYSRASTLEVLNQDYIRTARSKGLTERTVIMRHAFRNAMLPLASVVPVDLITVIGGALLTETVFGWHGMGKMFVDAMSGNLQDPVMGYILVVGIFAVIANFVADLVYAVLDPRIRVNA
ncbi:MAG TPA: ABC transporter permease [Nocardioidaceae bacterium]|nr:ABC transporter permease [Nocardioidaceae bacterium]